MDPAESRSNALKGTLTSIAIANADGIGQIVHEDLAIADFAAARRLHHGIDDLFGAVARHNHFQLHLRQQVDLVFHAAVNLFVAFLATWAAHLNHRHAIDADGDRKSVV